MKAIRLAVALAATFAACAVHAQARPVVPGQAGFVTVWGGSVNQPGQPLFAYPRFGSAPDGTGTQIVAAGVTIGGLIIGGSAGIVVSVLGVVGGTAGIVQGAQQAATAPTQVTFFPASGMTGNGSYIIWVNPPMAKNKFISPPPDAPPPPEEAPP